MKIKKTSLLLVLFVCLLKLTLVVTAKDVGRDNADFSSENKNAGLTVTYETSKIGNSFGSPEANAKFEEIDTIACTTRGSYTKFGIATVKTGIKNTLTFINSSASTQTLSFDLTIGNLKDGSLTINGIEYTSSTKNCTFELKSNATCNIVLTSNEPSGANPPENKITLSNITLKADNASVTFYPTINGTYKIEDTVIQNTDGHVISYKDSTVIELNPEEGYEFKCWMICENGQNTNIQFSASQKFNPPPDAQSLIPIFAPINSAKYLVGEQYFYYWSEAFTAAAQTEHKTVILADDGILNNDTDYNKVDNTYVTLDNSNNISYQIPNGFSFLVPYSDNSSTHTNLTGDVVREVETKDAYGNYISAELFRSLSISENASIVCEGNIRVDAKQYSSSNQYTGHIQGMYGQINLEQNSHIYLQNGGTLRAYGRIVGNGIVHAESGTNVYELFQITDWRGGTNSSNLYYNQELPNQSFLISQYYIQNIEAKLIIEYGASLTADATIAAKSLTGKKSDYNSVVKVVKDDGLFILSEGAKVTRSFNNGRIEYMISGTAKMGDISIAIDPGIGDGFILTSSNYVLNLPNNMTIRFADGITTLPFRVKTLPGTILQIDDGAVFKMTGDAELILYDWEDWNAGNYTYNGKYFQVQKPFTSPVPKESSKLIVNGTLIVEDGAAIYSTTAQDKNNNVLKTSDTGTIQIGASPSTVRSTIKEVNGSSTTLVDVAVTPLQAPLAGIATSNTDYTNSMAYNSTYKGLADNYWYQYVVKAAATDENGEPVAAKVTGLSAPTLENVDVSSEQTVGYIANSTTANGVFKFKVETPQGYELVNVKVGETELKDDENGIYSLPKGISQDTTISINFKKKVTVKISWDQTETAVYTSTKTTYTWNPLKLFYDTSEEGSWNNTKSVMSITLDNTESTGGFNATFTYDSKIEANTTWTGLTDNKLSVAAGQKGNATFTATPTEKPAKPENGSLTLGTITITLNKE